MKKSRAILALAIAALVVVPSAIAISGVSLPADISSNIVLVDPPLQITGATEDGAACTASGSGFACSSSFVIGATNSIVIDLSNSANAIQPAKSSTTAPSACSFTITDSSVSVPALGTASLTISISVSNTATVGMACTFDTTVS